MESLTEPADARRPRAGVVVPSVLLGAAALAVFLALARALWPFTVDDAFITLRYARNLAAGFGPTFDPGVPAEGYTTFLWMALLAIPHVLRVDALACAKAAGVLATLALLATTGRLALALMPGEIPHRHLVPAAGAVLWLACFPPTAVHAVSGMETQLFALLLTALLLLAARQVAAPGRHHPWAPALVALLLGLTRPEGNLAALAALATTAALLPRGPRGALLWASGLLYVLPGALYFAWRLAYYRHLLPLPYYVKVWDQRLLAGAPTVLGFLGLMAVPFGALVLLGLLRFDRRVLPALAALGTLLVFFLFPRPLMAYQWRYLAPIVPAIAALAARGLAEATDWLERLSRTARARAAGPALALLVAASLLARAPEAVADRLAYGRGLERAHVALGRELAPLASPLARPAGASPSRERAMARAAPRLALSDAGAVPYYSGWWTLDLFGLDEPRIALGGTRSPEWVMAQKPDVVVLVSTRHDEFATFPWNAYEGPLYRACRERGMTRVALYVFQPSQYYLWVMADPRGPAAAALAAGAGS
jgi:hypothetical protein